MSETNKPNICAFKRECQQCVKVTLDDRPSMCEAIQCPTFLPCPECGNNRTLYEKDGKKACKQCLKLEPGEVKRLLAERNAQIASGQMTILSTGKSGPGTQPPPAISRTLSITAPGTPPEELSVAERFYYETRWTDFKGHYRNPAAYYICHLMILQEVHTNYLSQKQINARGELAADISRELSLSVEMMKKLNEQLPEREAEEVMDDEKSLAMIYDRYTNSKKRRGVAGVSRFFRTDTEFLAPNLTFPIDPAEIIERCGGKLVSHEDMLKRLSLSRLTVEGKTENEVLAFFGFRLHEEFAMGHDVQVPDEDDIEPEVEPTDGTPT